MKRSNVRFYGEKRRHRCDENCDGQDQAHANRQPVVVDLRGGQSPDAKGVVQGSAGAGRGPWLMRSTRGQPRGRRHRAPAAVALGMWQIRRSITTAHLGFECGIFVATLEEDEGRRWYLRKTTKRGAWAQRRQLSSPEFQPSGLFFESPTSLSGRVGPRF
ncbi:tyrosine-protein kinase transforming protein Src [Striga asiatica]|uniref:Tyrosine-protein kinase transforming protein Src n=1 Tax=Striga asiatica TaxID=4170 RepID=A0A5A7P4D6_STRAF|nr:tyrosine-protein kinase transforming protein Src [Striga asiatica]